MNGSNRWALLVVVGLAVSVLVHHANGDAVATTPNKTIAMCTTLDNLAPSLYSSLIIEGVRQAVASSNGTARMVYLNITSSTDAASLRNISKYLVDQNVTHIVAGQAIVNPIFLVLPDIPGIFLTVIDPTPVPESIANRTQVIALRDDQVGYLAGLLAGSQTVKGLVAYAGGPKIQALLNMRAGFYSGVTQVCPSCWIVGYYLNSFNSASVNSTMVGDFIFGLGGPDVVWGDGGSTGSAVWYRMAGRGVYSIGVDADEYTTTLQLQHGQPIARMLLGSCIKRSDVAVRVALRDYLTLPSFTPQNRVLGAEQNCIALTPCHESCAAFTQRTNDTITETISRMTKGLVATQVDTATGYSTAPRDDSAFNSLSKPRIRSPPVAFNSTGNFVLLAWLWRSLFVFDGRWNAMAVYDDAVVAADVMITVTPPRAAPVLGGGHTWRRVQLTSSGEGINSDFGVLLGGLQGGAPSSAMFVFQLQCGSNVGLCTNNGNWSAVSQVGAPAALSFHSAATLSGVPVLYVAGGQDASGSGTSAIWSVALRIASGSRTTSYTVAATWSLLPVALPRETFLFSFGMWKDAVTSEITLVAAGGEERVLCWMTLPIDLLSGNTTTSATATAILPWWSCPTLSSNRQVARSVPIIYTRHPLGIMILGGGGPGRENIILRPKSKTRILSYRGIISNTSTSPLLSDVLSCAVLPAVSGSTTVSSPSQSPTLRTSMDVVAVVGMASSSSTLTAALHTFVVPSLTCDALRGLVSSDDLTSCVACSATIVDDDCVTVSIAVTRGANVPVVVIATICAFFFAVGVSAAAICVCLRRNRHASVLSRDTTNAPKCAPLAMVFVNAVNTSAVWQARPAEASAALIAARAAVSYLAAKHQCYEARAVADSWLIVAQDCRRAAALVSALMQPESVEQAPCLGDVDAARRKWFVWSPWTSPSWPIGLDIRVALHSGEPTVTHGHSMVQYTGADVELTMNARLLAKGGEVVVSDAFLSRLHEEDPSLKSDPRWGTPPADVVKHALYHGARTATFRSVNLLLLRPRAAHNGPSSTAGKDRMLGVGQGRGPRPLTPVFSIPPSPVPRRSRSPPPPPGLQPIRPSLSSAGEEERGTAEVGEATDGPPVAEADIHLQMPTFQEFAADDGVSGFATPRASHDVPPGALGIATLTNHEARVLATFVARSIELSLYHMTTAEKCRMLSRIAEAHGIEYSALDGASEVAGEGPQSLDHPPRHGGDPSSSTTDDTSRLQAASSSDHGTADPITTTCFALASSALRNMVPTELSTMLLGLGCTGCGSTVYSTAASHGGAARDGSSASDDARRQLPPAAPSNSTGD